MRLILLLVVSLLFLQCGNEKKQQTDTPTDDTMTTTSTPASNFASIPKETMMSLWDNCTSIDFIVIDKPYSISANDQQQSRAFLRHVSTDAATPVNSCSKTATISYLGSDGILLDADLYFADLNTGCNYFVFYEDGKAKYANKITQEGYDYYKQIFGSVQVQTEGQ
ncbi:MAG: hypothetical protein AAF806_17285 [Bacteroidota bacterium]